MSSHDSQTVNITVPKALLKQVDALAKRDYTTRSDIIRQALLDKIRRPQLDEWGEPVGEWEEVIDFRDAEHPDGVPMDEVVAVLEKLEKNDKQKRKTAGKTASKTA